MAGQYITFINITLKLTNNKTDCVKFLFLFKILMRYKINKN